MGANLVLHVALWQVPDGAGTEAQQDAAGIRGVALEIPPQRAVAPRRRHAVARQREVIEADLHVTGPRQRTGDRLGLAMPLEPIAQATFFDLALVLLAH